MALKGDWKVEADEISFSCETATEAGVVLCYHTAGSGVSLGDSSGKADLKSNPSGYVPMGYLPHRVVSLDETQYHRNFHKGPPDSLVGEKCWLITKGEVVTNKVSGTPTIGQTAYLTSSGIVTPTVHATGGTAATPKVGQFMSIKDENGYARVKFSFPVI